MRQSGILMHISSLPGPYGIGTMGKAARDFVDFLSESGQSCWQILPLSPTGYGDSPYQALSIFAGNPYLIDLDLLMEAGLLKEEEVSRVSWGEDPLKVNFGSLYKNRLQVLALAFRRFPLREDFKRFCSENSHWLPDYGLYMALKQQLGGRPWQQWPEALKFRDPQALGKAREQLQKEIRFHSFLQYVFFTQWQSLRDYAARKHIRIIGDVPIYVPMDSADTWLHPELFQLDETLQPTSVAGCPPDAFSAEGQLWGNPLYRWDLMKRDGYRWWKQRLEAASRLYDVVRLDHFRGFESYWAVPWGETTARNGSWMPGPGSDFISAIRETKIPCIAEDLGYVTEAVRALQESSSFPGMKVLQFGFDSREAGNYLPHTYPVNSICYSGTHDNLTLKQWLREAAPQDVASAKAYLGLNGEEGYVPGLLRGCMSSVSRLSIIQMQDWLELGGEARMNFPGTLSGENWSWRAPEGFCTQALASRIRTMTARYGRC